MPSQRLSAEAIRHIRKTSKLRVTRHATIEPWGQFTYATAYFNINTINKQHHKSVYAFTVHAYTKIRYDPGRFYQINKSRNRHLRSCVISRGLYSVYIWVLLRFCSPLLKSKILGRTTENNKLR